MKLTDFRTKTWRELEEESEVLKKDKIIKCDFNNEKVSFTNSMKHLCGTYLREYQVEMLQEKGKTWADGWVITGNMVVEDKRILPKKEEVELFKACAIHSFCESCSSHYDYPEGTEGKKIDWQVDL